MDVRIAFFGNTTITPAERALLQKLGSLLASAGAELHTSQTPGACAAVTKGYRASGGKPAFHTTKLHESAKWFVLYADDALLDRFMSNWQTPPDTTGWDLLSDPPALAAFCGRIEAGLKNLEPAP